MSGTTTTTTKTNRNLTSRFALIGALTLSILGGSFGLATSAGAGQVGPAVVSPDDEAELGTSMSIAMGLDAYGLPIMIITEVDTDGTITTSTVAVLSGTISGIDDARRLVNVNAM